MRPISRTLYSVVLSFLLALTTQSLAVDDACTETWNFEDVDIGLVIDEVARRTGKKFVIDPRVAGLVTIKSGAGGGLCREEAWELFQAALRVNGFTATPIANGAYKVVPSELGAREAVLVERDAEAGYVTEIIRLAYADAREAASSITQIVGESGVVAPIPSTNSVIVVDTPGNLARVRDVLDRIDRDSTAVESFTLANVSAAEAAQTIAGLAEVASEGGDPGFAAVQATPVGSSNRLLLRGRPEAVARLRRIVAEIDQFGGEDVGLSVVALEHADATAVASLLQSLAADVAPAGEGAASPRVTVSPFPATNSVIILGDADIQRTLKSIVAQLDIRRQQVLVEAIIVEVSDATARALGLNYVLADQDGERLLFSSNIFQEAERSAFANAGASLLTDDRDKKEDFAIDALEALLSINGFAAGGAGALGGGQIFGAILTAVKEDDRSRVLSFPSVVTLDNEPATISVGQEIPITTGEAIGDDFSNAFRTVSREEVGIILKVTPQINVGGTITLQIAQESSSIAGPIISTSTDLITNKRAITTTAIVDDGDILVIGGLVDQSEQNFESKTPLLGDVPVFGNLFKSSGRSRDSRNLMVFIRPTIMGTQEAARRATQAKLDYIEAVSQRSGGRGEASLRQTISAVIGGPAAPMAPPEAVGDARQNQNIAATTPAPLIAESPAARAELLKTPEPSLTPPPAAPAPSSPAPAQKPVPVTPPVAAGLEPREPLEIPNVAPSKTTTELEAPSVDVDAAGDHEGRGADALVLQSVMTPQSDLALVSALFGVHLASYRAEASALDGWDTLQEQFPNEIGALKPRLAPFADPQRGDFLRLIAGPVASEDAAQAICETLRQTGAYCAVTAYMGRKM